MLKRSFASKDRVGKVPAKGPSSNKRSFDPAALKQKLRERALDPPAALSDPTARHSAVVTFSVGGEGRTFAAHEEVLRRSPFLEDACRELFFSSRKCIDLGGEDPMTFSLVLEYLYRGDYSPRLLHGRHGAYVEGDAQDPISPPSAKSTFFRKDATGAQQHPATLLHAPSQDVILRDTAVYCAGLRYGLPELQRLALRKQGLQTGIDVGTILRSMRFAYANTPDTDSRLRAHFLALVVRARKTFKRSWTMQQEMARGGTMFFDLFVALCNHLDDLSSGVGASLTPKTI